MHPKAHQYHSCGFCQKIIIDFNNRHDPLAGDEVATDVPLVCDKHALRYEKWWFLGVTLESILAARSSCVFADKLSRTSNWRACDDELPETFDTWPEDLDHIRLIAQFGSSAGVKPIDVFGFFIREPNSDGRSWKPLFENFDLRLMLLTERPAPRKCITNPTTGPLCT